MALLAPQIPQLTELDLFERDALIVLSFVAMPLTAKQWAEWANDCQLSHDRVPAGRMAALGERLVALRFVDKRTLFREIVFEPSLSVPSLLLPQAHEEQRLSRLWARFNKVATTPPRGSKRRPLNLHDWDTRLRALIGELRVMLTFSNSQRVVASLIELERWSSFRNRFPQMLLDMLGADPPEHWISQLPEPELDEYLGALIEHCTTMLSPLPRGLPIWVEECAKPGAKQGVARLLALRGQSDAIAKLRKLPKWGAEGAELLTHFVAGDYGATADAGDTTAASMKRRHKQLPGIEGVIHALSRVVTMDANPARAAAFDASLTAPSRARVGYEACYHALALFQEVSRSPTPTRHLPRPLEIPLASGITWIHLLVRCLCIHWLGHPLAKHAASARPWLVYWHSWAVFGGYAAIARELAAVLALVDGDAAPPLSLAAHYKQRKPWETILEALEASVKVAQVGASAGAGDGGFRKHIIWEVALGQHAVDIKARLITSARTTKGQLLSVTKLKSGELDYLTDADRRVIATVPNGPSWRGHASNSIGHDWSTLEALIDHPRVRRTSGLPLRLTRGQPTIRTRTEDGTTILELHPAELASREVVLHELVADHVEVYAQKPGLDRVYSLFSQGGQVKIPDAGRERLLDSLAGLATSTELIIEGEDSLAGHSVDADPRLVMQLQWNGSTFVAHAKVAPLGPDGPHFAPGDGPVKIVGRVASQMLACTRDPGEENRAYQAMLAACPCLDSQPEDEGRWSIHELDTALEVLLELHALGDEITLTWPLERKLGVPRELTNQDMRVAVQSNKDWLQVDLELSVDEARVLGFKQLLDSRRGDGRFIALGDDQFVALTSDLRRRIDALENLGTLEKSGLEIHPVTLPLLEQIVAEPGALRTDKQARARLDKLAKIAGKTPRLPRGFQATLRDYQSEGFKWMARLAEAGLGAVLADDMGLGKTIQALALLCQRAKQGPALVVAPTSVVGNWLNEAERFAPRLRCHQLASSDDRAALMASLRGGDVLMCSYGLLVTESQPLTELRFGTVVFDEAHALKNSSSQRAKAAAALTSEFRLSLTGTPIENHLGELWSVFRATVPGLLGTEKRFEQRFTRPISQGQRERARQLRAMVRPFMLRRTKAQVLDELPPRTEVTIRVTPGAAEKAYYEALRRDAVEQTKGIKTKGRQAGQSRLKILALITKLRQAAVDPRLIDPEHGPPGAKLEALIRRLIDLRDEGHRALVFTQFLGSMDTIRQRLDKEKIQHLSFDGSTPAAQRTKVVEAFQAGEADVFVMSLKAGGVGINLTAADYVIHLDPWWNPAVEDQATGRAHRIGQQRPVTVYRLVTAGTIEEQILELHASKRDLADDLLAGLDSAKKLDLDELRALLQAGA
ncbi:Superfamily II DNA/RNA helicase, SNF2 family protein [Enhygromyxa salina]|uniref:Superfamily II DNA/RNA helicase, SNF2 family protein n=1 Tax=Enhygromyxa salina TaxID=215803 RepID=A0A0C2D735_9BACT|nr:DEAD/DEAH box helicase [Enhygromyxa salina]KIG18991.1 Superfamily II DNA/RNA helicase, SNF2 family protein [Enhygromyxa salina]